MPIMPNPQPLSGFELPEGAVTMCSSYTGDCLWFTVDDGPQVPGHAPRIRMGDAAGTFQPHTVEGHELAFFARSFIAEMVRRGGLADVQDWLDRSPEAEPFPPEVYDVIQRDTADRLAELAKQHA
jgi:hypothetical protein